MTKLEVFTNRIESVGGVESFVLVRQSGEIVTHNMKNPDDLASMVTICGIGSNAIKQTIGFSHFKHMMFNRIDQRNFLVFLLDRYLLGIQQVSGADDQQLTVEIYNFIQNLLEQSSREVQQ